MWLPFFKPKMTSQKRTAIHEFGHLAANKMAGNILLGININSDDLDSDTAGVATTKASKANILIPLEDYELKKMITDHAGYAADHLFTSSGQEFEYTLDGFIVNTTDPSYSESSDRNELVDRARFILNTSSEESISALIRHTWYKALELMKKIPKKSMFKVSQALIDKGGKMEGKPLQELVDQLLPTQKWKEAQEELDRYTKQTLQNIKQFFQPNPKTN